MPVAARLRVEKVANHPHGGAAEPLDGSNAQPAIAATAVFDSAMTLKAGCRGYEDPGDWGNTLKIWVGNLKDSVFDLTVSKTIKDANGGEKKTELETWFSLSLKKAHPRYIVNILNDQYAGSKNVMVDPATVNDVLLTVQEKSMQGGKNGVFASPEALAKSCANAIDLFKLTNVQLMTCPVTCDAENFLPTALAHCEEMGDRLYVGYTPIDRQATEADMNAFSGKLRGDKVYGALYFPWIRVRDPLGTQKWIPPVGHVLGVYARTDRERGVWKAPAGNAVKILGAVDVKHHITEVEHTKLVKNCGVNAIRFIPGQGIVVDSSRTLSTNPLWLYVNIRLLFNFVKSSLKTGLRWVVQEPNDETLWNKVKYNSVTPFLMGLWRRGAFGSGSPEDTFTVKIDRENNPEADVQQGILNVEVYFYPSRPAETIVIKVGQQEGGASASEG